MDETNVIDIRSKQTPDQFRDWDDDCLDAAFEAWALLDGGVCTKVAKRLASGHFVDEDGNPQYWDVPARTVQLWVKRHGWPVRRDAYFAANFGSIRRRIAGNLMLAADEGSEYVRAVNAGEVSPDRDRLTSSIAAVDRVGFSPVGNRDVVGAVDAASQQPAPALPETVGRTVDELMRIERELRAKRGK